MTEAARYAGLVHHLSERLRLESPAIPGVRFDLSSLMAAVPNALDWANSTKIAYTINGYELSPLLGFGEVGTLANRVADQVAAGGEFPDGLDVLWLCLFYEQRRWRHFGTDPSGEALAYLDELCSAFARQASRGLEPAG